MHRCKRMTRQRPSSYMLFLKRKVCTSQSLNYSIIGVDCFIVFDLSLHTILRVGTKLGWVFRGSAYCQTIRCVVNE